MKYMNTETYITALHALPQDKIYIVGAGQYGEVLGWYFNKYSINFIGYIDKRINLGYINGKNVYSYEQACKYENYYVISTYQYMNEITDRLKMQGIEEEHIIAYDRQEIFYDLFLDLVNWERYTVKLKEFKGKHMGERCFVIGNGPSLRIEDLERLNNVVTFASNSIFALYEHTDWRPVYYCAIDPVFCKTVMADKKKLRTISDACAGAFVPVLSEGIKYINDSDINNLYYVKRLKKINESGLPYFSESCDEQVYSGGTVTYDMLQLAVYMGFKEIYLLGVDFHYYPGEGDENHMKELSEITQELYAENTSRYGVPYIVDMDLQSACYRSTKKYADAHGIQIYNATRGGLLEVFERVDFDSLI